jgi:hypothetical protein
MRKILLFLLIICFDSSGQQHSTQEIENVFQRLVLAYGNPKAAPLLIIPKKNNSIPAFYSKIDKSVTIDPRLTLICRKLGKDSINALSIIISHELAHYYSEHDFCSDFGWAMRTQNLNFSKKIIQLSITQKLIFETQADKKGIFYSAIAGFQPFGINAILLDQIYIDYYLKDLNGYPTKTQRKEIGKLASIEISSIYENFKQGIHLFEQNKFEEAINIFEVISRDFPSREIYNNIGVAKTRLALLNKPLTKEESDFPERFKYPIEIENLTRLNKESTRSIRLGSKFEELLKSALTDFEKSISLDPIFVKSYINLACVFELLDNPENAIGTIRRLSKNNQNSVDAKRILAIAYFHSNREFLAENIWKELSL